MLAALATLAALTVAGGPAAPARASGDPIRINLNGGGDYQPGDAVKAQVQVAEDGYLIVFRVDGDGFIRVLFPLDPDLDAFVRGGRRYELRGRGDHQSFLADDRGGTGLILAAIAREPYNLGAFVAGDHWEYDRLRLEDPLGDAEAQLLGILRQMTDNGRFDYDVVGYRVWGPGYESTAPTIVAGGGWVDPSWGIGLHLGSGWYDPWYDPWYYGSYYRNGWSGFWGWDPFWGTPWRPITVVNTYPRNVRPNPVYGTRSRPRQPVLGGGASTAPRLTEPGYRPPPRPVDNGSSRTRARDDGRSSGGTVSPSPSTSRGGTASPSRPTTSAPERSRARRPNNETVTRPIAPAVERRQAEERPVYRPPSTPTRSVPQAPSRIEPRSIPASSPPPRVERSAPPPSAPAGKPSQSSPRSRSRPDN